MRTEEQVIEQVLAFARDHDEIRAVVMNGSRANPIPAKDLFCDYDIVYYVDNPRRFLEDQRWIQYFGSLVILQQNDFVDHELEGFIFLMLFADGVRIDLCFDALPTLAYLGEDTLTVVLLDKDQRAPSIPPPSDQGYLTLRPSRKEFDEALNEIFWCSNNIAKGIWRGELPYVKSMLDVIVRPCILQVLAWYAADLHGWAINTGKFGKWLEKYLPVPIWERYVTTYSGTDYEGIWDALLEALRLVRETGRALADSLGYAYPLEDDRRVVEYLRHVRALPANANSFDEL
jgi:aminoglycoside 6-adenylyltransferase